MGDTMELAPACGWASFDQSAQLTEAIWSLAMATDWHYLNLTTCSSVWESRRDATTLIVHYDADHRVVQMTAEVGHASDLAALLTERFGLAPTAERLP